jgi:hypothetical protein
MILLQQKTNQVSKSFFFFGGVRPRERGLKISSNFEAIRNKQNKTKQNEKK